MFGGVVWKEEEAKERKREIERDGGLELDCAED